VIDALPLRLRIILRSHTKSRGRYEPENELQELRKGNLADRVTIRNDVKGESYLECCDKFQGDFGARRDGAIWLSKTPEGCAMKRLTEWISLFAAVIRLINVISRTGWF
jgi:hypothetical protein